MKLLNYINQRIKSTEQIPQTRKKKLNDLLYYMEEKRSNKEDLKLNFICTHNSRRSQLAQIWAQTAADFFGIPCQTFSAGVKVTAFNYRAIDALKSVGFQIESGEGQNPKVIVDNGFQKMNCFSKMVEDEVNPKESFAAIMTCSHADENCPIVLGMEKRIALNYEDPGSFDGTELETEKYLERSEQIANEMFYVFGSL